MTGQIKELSKQVKDLEGKTKKSPDDLKSQVQSFIENSKQEIEILEKSLKVIDGLMKDIAAYLCEDESKFKLESCLGELNTIVTELETAVKVI